MLIVFDWLNAESAGTRIADIERELRAYFHITDTELV